MIDSMLAIIASIIKENLWLAPMFAALAGIISSVSPCSLSSIPLIIGYVGGVGQQNTKRAFGLSFAFALGSAFTYTLLGIIAAYAGRLIGNSNPYLYLILGFIMLLMALQILSIIDVLPSAGFTSKSNLKGYAGAVLAGILGGFLASPCATPVLIVLLGILAKGGNALWGAFLMLCYSLGSGVLIVIAGTFVGYIQKIISDERYGKFSRLIKTISGIIILLISFYMLYLGF